MAEENGGVLARMFKLCCKTPLPAELSVGKSADAAGTSARATNGFNTLFLAVHGGQKLGVAAGFA